tara:strand:+ start:72 stop:299 length:228 start_codon:yes stop_codon:yes gene_type:complete
MPSYTMKNPEGIEHDMICTIADMEQKKEEGWTMVFSPPKNNLIGHTGDVISHTSDGWKEVLQKIKSKSPGSDIEI